MAVPRGPLIYGVGQVELFDDYTGPQIEVLVDDLHELGRGLIRRAVRFHEERERFRDADGVGELHESATGDSGVHEGFGDPAREIGG